MNLIICLSPLQVLIAERIAKLYPGEQFYGVMYSYSTSEKSSYYYKRMQAFCSNTYFFLDLEGKSRCDIYRETLCLLKRGYRLPRAKRLFIASLDLLPTHLLLWAQGKAEVVTYDDGTINLNTKAFNQIMYKESGMLQKLLHRWMGVPTVRSLLGRQSLHYTIYPYHNVLPNAKRIELFPTREDLGKETTETVHIFLGQPIYEYLGGEDGLSAEVSARVVREYGITHYYPHPREQYEVEGVEYVHSPLIFEDYILRELDKHPERCYRIYGFCSSVFLNLQDIGRLEFIAVRPKVCPEYLEETYQLFARCGIRIDQLSY